MLNRFFLKMGLKFKLVAALLIGVAVIILLLRLTASPLLSTVNFSSAIYDRGGQFLRLTLSSDGIYRVNTPIEHISPKFIDATLLYEDRWFLYHIGVNPFSVVRGFMSLLRGGGRPLGGSTITMQLARMKFDINSTTVTGKIYQIFCAFYLEACYSKKDILEAYLNLAPYGHNIEGVSGASLIYFGIKPLKLSSVEALTLAVIPQNPTLRTPTNDNGMARIMDARKRLWQAWLKKYPQDNDYEPLLNMKLSVNKIGELPYIAPHFVNNILASGYVGDVETVLDVGYQKLLEKDIDVFIKRNSNMGVQNAAALLINHRTMDILGYVGSVDFYNKDILGQVDGVKALRSPGSAMKPFIFGLAVEQGLIHPKSMLKDAPRRFGAYSPENSDKGFMGPIFASDALVHSRNIPAIDILNRLDNSSFYNLLKQARIKKLRKEEYYGSALALGGFEMTMLDMVLFYGGLANFGKMGCINFLKNGEKCEGEQFRLFSDEAASLVLDMLAGNPKPIGYWDVGRVSWKTGTTFAYKDGWSVGIFGDYVLAVWVGNFDGTGNPVFTGRGMAAKLFFTIIRSIRTWQGETFGVLIPPKILNIKEVDICSPTGDLAGALCPQTEKGKFIAGVSPIKVSDIFREVAIDKETGLRACKYNPKTSYLKVYEFWSSDIYDLFVKSGIRKNVPPPYLPSCDIEDIGYSGKPPFISSPTAKSVYYIERDETDKDELGFIATADGGVKRLFWFVNGKLVGESEPNQPLFWKTQTGNHRLTVTDEMGRSDAINFKVELR